MVQTRPRRGSWAVDWVMTQSLNELMAFEGLDRGKEKLDCSGWEHEWEVR